MNIFDDVRIRLGLGTLKLGTQGRPDALEAVNLIVFALNQGLQIIDTADSYCLDQSDFHYGEHMVRQAVQKWSGDKTDVHIVTN